MSLPSWQLVRAKRLYEVVDERAGDQRPPLLAVSIHHGVVPRSSLTEDGHRADDLSAYKLCEAGDIVLNRMRAFQGAIGVAPSSGLVSPDYLVLRPGASADARFLHHLFRSVWFVSEMALRLRGIGSVDQGNVRTPRINSEDLGDILVPVPTRAEQRAIANFLDRETTRLDALIAAKRSMIELLKERFRSQVAAALSPWERAPLKRVVTFTEGPGIMADDFRDSGVPLIRVAGVGSDTVTLDGCNYLDPEKVRDRWAHFALAVGDYLISASASMGTVSIVDETAAGAIPYTGLIRFRPVTDAIEMRYVYHFLSSEPFVSQIDLLKTGTAIQHFGPTHLGEVAIPLPNLHEQRRIARTLDNAERRNSMVTLYLRNQIELLAEHRQALITAAVTGEIDMEAAA